VYQLVLFRSNSKIYSNADAQLMQRSLDSAVRQLNGQDLSDDEINTLARFVRAAFIIGNRDMESMARFAVKAVLIRRKSRAKTQL
jgi:hypothetical protein